MIHNLWSVGLIRLIRGTLGPMTPGCIPPHGQYRKLLSFRKAEVGYDITVRFCDRFLERRDRTVDQMVQAARSGKQNIAEGSQASGTSTETEIKLTSVARASLEELRVDYEDYLRVRDLRLWSKDSREAHYIRNLGRAADLSLIANIASASSIRPITCSISRSAVWKPTSSRKVASASK